MTIPKECDNPTWHRLEDQIAWYDSKSTWNQKRYKLYKIIEITAAALIPVLAVYKHPLAMGLTSGFGVLIVVLEGVQHLYQYQHNWVTYRSTCEGLKHEKYLRLAEAGPYSTTEQPSQDALFAERVESLLSQEHSKWVASRERAEKGKKTSVESPEEGSTDSPEQKPG